MRYHRAVVLTIIFIGIALRLIYLDRSMRFDESLTFLAYISRNAASIMADYSEPNNHIFYTLLTHIVYKLAGNHPLILRVVAWMAGILLMPLSYRLARRMFNPQVGLISCALVAVMPPLIDFSVNARGYSLQAMITLILFILALQMLKVQRDRYFLLFGVMSALGFLTIPTMIYAMGAVSLWVLWIIWLNPYQRSSRQQKTLLKNFMIALLVGAVLTIVLYMPVIMFSGLDQLVSNHHIAPVETGTFYRHFLDNFESFFTFTHRWLPLSVVLGISIGAVLGIWVHPRLSITPISPLLPAFIWVTTVLIIQRVFPWSRVILPLIPLYLIVAAGGLFYLLKHLPGYQQWLPGMVLAFCLLMGGWHLQQKVILNSPETGRAEDAETAAFYFSRTLYANDTIFYSYPTNFAVLYYEKLHKLNPVTRPTTNNPTVYLYYHSPEERKRLIGFLVEEYPNYIHATYEVVHQFEHSTLEIVTPVPQAN